MTTFRNRWSIAVPALFIAFAPMQAEAQAPAPDNVFNADGVPIHYADTGGDGAPVILIHSVASSSELWTEAGVLGAGDYRYIAIDARGHGLSGKPLGPDSYGIMMVDDIVGLLDNLDIEAAGRSL